MHYFSSWPKLWKKNLSLSLITASSLNKSERIFKFLSFTMSIIAFGPVAITIQILYIVDPTGGQLFGKLHEQRKERLLNRTIVSRMIFSYKSPKNICYILIIDTNKQRSNYINNLVVTLKAIPRGIFFSPKLICISRSFHSVQQCLNRIRYMYIY